ncbi:hypothetical protein EVG20_g9241 [Dentipellis fragilis]|uniref:F-box domain-containing protein n=1 Tax=Dentipellis fragilis TaxID=205917 RepID=A0A4Y9XZR6_9AGAM|nr:hypothetical protein EVG20_g9241 [Dentipellis fragilis]
MLPGLSVLDLHDCTISWQNFPRLDHVTFLSLVVSDDFPSPPDHAYPFESVLKALRGLPNLEQLVLHRIFSETENLETFGFYSGVYQGTAVELPRLDGLYLEGHSDLYALAFAALELPSSSTVSFFAEITHPDIIDVVLAKCQLIMERTPIMKHRRRIELGHVAHFSSVDFRDLNQAQADEEVSPPFHIRLDQRFGDLFIDKVCQHLRFDDIAHLVLHVYTRDRTFGQQHPISRIFETCQSVTDLKVFGELATDGITVALSESPTSPPNANGESETVKTWQMLPELQSLELQLYSKIQNSNLTEALRMRHESGSSLQQLCINFKDGRISEDERIGLQRCVVDLVRWKRFDAQGNLLP